ncbi:Cell cycle checkpoint protein RAD1 [Grifola frondosa]|uniref:Cell cycle checkpoint protein RAD1 n=1 Tax=Grifola frondosa TaxID=5627 RepID=A0A1C7MFR9_GRIFR|nr:Cell cycle checkpoint protein RAD1 [Grifola frondosa]
MSLDDEGAAFARVMTASVHDIRYFAALLRGVNFNNRATFIIAEDGFTVTVEEARTLTATAYVSNIAEKGTGMHMSYTGPGYPLTLLVAEDSSGQQLVSRFEDYIEVLLLRDALSELDPSSEKLTIIGNPPSPGGRAARASHPHDCGCKRAGTCECAQSVSFSYRFSHISRTLRALQSSIKTSLRIDDEGLLSLQFMMPLRAEGWRASEAFIEFRCLPLDEDS